MCSISEFLSDLNRICVTLTNTTREICIFSQTLLNKMWVIYKKTKTTIPDMFNSRRKYEQKVEDGL
jgi:hypothetical protein